MQCNPCASYWLHMPLQAKFGSGKRYTLNHKDGYRILAIGFLIQLTQKSYLAYSQRWENYRNLNCRDITSPPRREEGRMTVSAPSKNSIERPYIPFPYALCPNSNICFAVSLLSACSFATCKAHATKWFCLTLLCKQLKLQPRRCVTNGREHVKLVGVVVIACMRIGICVWWGRQTVCMFLSIIPPLPFGWRVQSTRQLLIPSECLYSVGEL